MAELAPWSSIDDLRNLGGTYRVERAPRLRWKDGFLEEAIEYTEYRDGTAIAQGATWRRVPQTDAPVSQAGEAEQP